MSLYVRKKFAKYSPQVNPTSFLKIHASQYILAHETLKKLRKSPRNCPEWVKYKIKYQYMFTFHVHEVYKIDG